jgi:hypothetical protein
MTGRHQVRRKDIINVIWSSGHRHGIGALRARVHRVTWCQGHAYIWGRNGEVGRTVHELMICVISEIPICSVVAISTNATSGTLRSFLLLRNMQVLAGHKST